MIVNITTANIFNIPKEKLPTGLRDVVLIIQTEVENLAISVCIPAGIKRLSLSTIYSFIREGCFCINPYSYIMIDKDIIGKVELDKQRVIECLREARGIELWTTYMDKTQQGRLDKILLNPEILIHE